MEAPQQLKVEVCYAKENRQVVIALAVPVDATVLYALQSSKILQQFPEIDLERNRVGIFGKLTSLNSCLQDHDRIEIYRALKNDPKSARRKRAIQQNAVKKTKP